MHVTILMSVYNGAALLPEAISTIQRQTFKDWDLLVVDDGSTDSSVTILENFCRQDSRIQLIRNDRNYGLAFSLNRASKQASGELLARADVDDYNFPERLELQEKFMRENPHVDVLGSAAELVGEDGKSLGVCQRPLEHAELARKMYRESPFFHSAVLMRRRYLQACGGYNEKLAFSQDQDLWLRTYKSACFANLQQPLIRYQVKARQRFVRTFWAVYVMARRAILDGCILTKGIYPVLYACSALAARLGLHEHRAR